MTAFSSALSSSANRQSQSEEVQTSSNQKTTKQSLNNLLGITGMTQQEAHKLFEDKFNPRNEDDDAPAQTDKITLKPKLDKKRC